MHGAANFAYANRQLMAQLVRYSMRRVLGDRLEIHTVYDVAHNMVRQERHRHRDLWVHRKGATRAFPAARMRGTPFESTGQPVLIPGSMGTASYLLAGIETGEESLYSVNHGAGRTMSRTAAAGVVSRKGKVVKPGVITDAAFRESMRGVYLLCEDRRSIKEEAPGAYKDIDRVVQTVAGAGLATIVARMVPLAVLKG
jgi:tRNA-splicing ligase RtcB